MSNSKITDSQKAEYQAKRDALFSITADLIPLAKAQNCKVNDLLIAMYAKQIGCGTSDFNTFYGWKLKGFKVKKGEKGFAIWSRPKDTIKEEKTGQKAEDENKFFGLAYMFHKGQVEAVESAGTGAN
jgi:hypothetical protein